MYFQRLHDKIRKNFKERSEKMNKKILSILLITLILFFPLEIFAKELDMSKYKSTSLKEVFEEEKITFTESDLEVGNNAVTIYLFRGKGCGFCSKFLNYVATTLLKDYKGKINIVSYEVWYNKDNAELMEKIEDFLDDDAGGVPYYVIGDKTFVGYAESMNKEITDAIDTLYESSLRYDVLEEIQNEESPTTKESTSSNTAVIILFQIIITGVATGVILYFENKNKLEILKMLEKPKKK